MLGKLAAVELGPLPKVEFETSISALGKFSPSDLNPFWLSGFATGEGSFTYFTQTRVNLGKIVKNYYMVIEISQKTLDIHVLNLIASYYKVGKVYTDTRGISRFRLRSKEHIINTLIPHFKDYPLAGHKELQFCAWVKIVTFLNDQTRSDQRDAELERLINELSNLSKNIEV